MSQLPPVNKPPTISKAAAIARLWAIPNLTYKLHSTQKDMYNKLHTSNDKIMVVACSRAWGKTYALLTTAIELCLKKPNAIVKYLAPTAKDLKTVVLPNFRAILEDCPKSIRDKIKYKANEGKIVFEMNGSEIHLAGTEKGNAEKVRGISADLCIVDEAGFCHDLEYIIKSILLPTITRGTGTKGKKILMASTPSKTNDHDFIKYMNDYEFSGKLIKYTIYDNERMTNDAIDSGYSDTREYIEKEIAAPIGGLDSSSFQREYMCNIVVDEDKAVVPEFNDPLVQAASIKVWPTPVHYDGYVSMDIGFKDLTFVIFALYDFQNAKLIIKEELVLSGKSMLTDNLAAQVKSKEALAYFNPVIGETNRPHLRVADNNNLILLQDLSVKHDLAFMPTAKDNFDGALNNMRMLIKSGKIIIDPKCENLIKHLKSGTWNSAKTSFARSPDKGHYDGIAALMYLCRNVNFQKNPNPAGDYNPNYFYQDQTDAQPKTAFEKFAKDLFTPKLRNRRRN